MRQNKNLAVMARRLSAFTLIELMIVVVILGIIAAFSIPNYSKSVERSYERDGTINLMAIYTAQKIYFNNNNEFVSGADLASLNSALELGLIANGVLYACTGSMYTFSCTATRGDNGFVLKVNKDLGNPCCASEECPSVARCGS